MIALQLWTYSGNWKFDVDCRAQSITGITMHIDVILRRTKILEREMSRAHIFRLPLELQPALISTSEIV